MDEDCKQESFFHNKHQRDEDERESTSLELDDKHCGNLEDETIKEVENDGKDQPVSFGIRKSDRVRKIKQMCTADEGLPKNSLPSRNKFKRKGRRFYNSTACSSDQSFCCDICKSPYVINPLRKTNKTTKKKQTPRHKIDPNTKKILTLCNACGLAVDHVSHSKKQQPPISLEEKHKYLEDGRAFASLIAKSLNNPNANQLYCLRFKKQGCGCLQNFIRLDGNFEETKNRANHLLDLMNEAKQLSQQKCYVKSVVNKVANDNSTGSKSHKTRGNIGLGNGQKRSRQYEEFVLRNRQYLREQLNLCERATQCILNYSNNFLHKRLKTEPSRGSRIQRRKGKAALGLLIPLEELPTHRCCAAKCVCLATTHLHLLKQWRERAKFGQAEARRVLAEMLIPCGGARSNCYRFISMVTGCSHSTICSVSDQMKRTGGDREPPEHGLKQWWKEHPRAKPLVETSEGISETDNKIDAEDFVTSPENFRVDHNEEVTDLPLSSSDTALQLQMTRQQLLQLQRQVTQQQMQIQQQQQIIEQQLFAPQIQHVLQQVLQTKGTTNLNSDTLTFQQRIVNLPNNSVNKVSDSDQQTKSSPTNAEVILQRMLLDYSPDPSNSLKNVELNHITSHSLLTEPSNDIPPGVNITILQRTLSDADSSADHITSRILTSSGFENVVLIDPILVPTNSNIDTQSDVNSTTNLYNSSNNWDDS